MVRVRGDLRSGQRAGSGDPRAEPSGCGSETRAQPPRGRGRADGLGAKGDLRSGRRAGSGDPRRSAAGSRRADRAASVATLFMAAVQGEFIKGYHVAHEACRMLRQSRSDFELVVTFDPPGRIDEFTRSVGWCSQADLPRHYHAADICLVPTIAQEGLSRTSVEAMASGIPVIASRIGGLPFTVSDGVTGLLFEPGDPATWPGRLPGCLTTRPCASEWDLPAAVDLRRSSAGST